MKLQLHVGIYKAGSSYLQYLCVSHRTLLKENRIYFPKSSEDDKMKLGLISKGNDNKFTGYLSSKNTSKIKFILNLWYSNAKREGCVAVLISAEAMIHQIAVKDKFNFLIREAKNAGFAEIEIMGFFRDLADHALSTYKHRAKNGNLGDHINWVKHVYETPYLLKSLDKVISSSHQNVNWTLRKFKKDSNYLNQAFFKDWLKIDIPNQENIKKVNESVTISEIIILNHVKKSYAKVLDFFVNDLKALPKKQKAVDKDLEKKYFNEFVQHLNNFSRILDNLNINFAVDEKLIIGNKYNTYTDEGIVVKLSEMQIQTICNRILFFNSLKGKYVLVRRLLVKKFIARKHCRLDFDYMK